MLSGLEHPLLAGECQCMTDLSTEKIFLKAVLMILYGEKIVSARLACVTLDL